MPKSGSNEQLLDDAVKRARQAREAGVGGETTRIMRHMLDAAIHRSTKRHRRLITGLVVALIAVAGYSGWRILHLQNEKSGIDQQIVEIEATIERGRVRDEELRELLDTLDGYQQQARALQDSVFYKVGVQGREEAFIEREIGVLMEEFGAEQYSVPPEFVIRVRHYVDRYRNEERGTVERALGSRREDLDRMREIFAAQNLPPDLVYMVLVESSLLARQESPDGAAGLWQLTPDTARAYGLEVSEEVDERFDIDKASGAAASYLRDLILDFGSGNSVMLALAAYNFGPGRVKRAVRKVEDPINQRNFWYLYRIRALPGETRHYVPKLFAAIIVGRNLDRFGI